MIQDYFFEKKYLFLKLLPFFILSLVPLSTSTNFFESEIGIKWILIYISVTLCLISFCIERNFYLPKLNLFQSIVVTALILSILLNFFREEFHLYSSSTLNRLSFWIIFFHCLYIFNNVKEKFNNIYLIIYIILLPLILIGISSIGCILIYFFDIFPLNTKFLANATFGNKNMLAEFLGFCLVIILSVIDYEKNNINFTKFLKITSSILVVYIYYLACRSVILATLFSIIFLLYSKRLKYQSFFKIVACTIIILISLQLPKFDFINHVSQAAKWSQIYQYTNEYKFNTVTAYERINFWKSTLLMIKENPYGIGSNEFEFKFLPYKALFQQVNSETIEKSPHNEYLRFLCEEGIIVFLLGIILILSLLKKLLKVEKKDFYTDFFISIGVYYAIQSFFQFPLELPFPFYFISILLAFFFYHFYPMRITQRIPIVFPIIAVVLYTKLAFSFSLADYYVGTAFDNSKKMKIATQLDPHNWVPAVLCMQNLYKLGEYEETLFQASLELKKRPYNFIALYYKGFSEYSLGLVPNACKSFSDYHKILEYNNKYYQDFVKICNKI